MAATLMYVTTETTDEALRIGRQLEEERLAACANVIPGTTAVYWWEGAVQEGAEAILVVKTRADLVDAATARIKALHSYSCPCVVAFAVAGGNRDFLDWIARETVQHLDLK